MKTLSRFFAAAVAACLLALPSATPLAAQDFKVIVNSANPISEIPAAALSKIFLKEAAGFPGGGPATPVDLSKSSPVRATFSKRIIGRPVSAVDTYWQQQIFSGKEVPPAAKASDDDVIAFVKATPGAVGYVSAGASTAGVKVVDVK
jgi:ABC-type phosphate transport system substrate-binding protein